MPSTSPKPETSKTLAEQIHRQVRADILAGRLLPGQKLKLGVLCEQHGVSLSIVREALTRLAAEKLVRAQPQQGFTVTALSPGELEDLTFLRIETESLAIRRSIELGDVGWEARILGAHHTLANTPVREADGSERLSEAYTAAHAVFHAALIDACGSPMLIDLCRSLYDASELYRRLSYLLNRGKRNKTVEHRSLMDAALARDAGRATSLIAAHYQSTTRSLIESGVLERQKQGAAA